MTVSAQNPVAVYTANGATTDFSLSAKVLISADLKVYLNDALQVGGYSVSGIGNDGGVTVSFSAAPSSGTSVLLKRDLDISRTTDYPFGGKLSSDVLDLDQDRQTMMLQQLDESIGRALVVDPGVSVDLGLPSPSANQLIGWNANADGLENKSPVSGSVVVAADVSFQQSGTGAVTRDAQSKLREIVSIKDFGASTGAGSATNDAAISHAFAVSNEVYVPDGTFLATTASIPYLKDLNGPGFISISGTVLPAGDIESSVTIPFPSVFSAFADIITFLSTRRIRRGATITISIAAGTHTFSGNGIEPYHPDGERINIVGAGSGSTTLKFTGLGAASSKAGVRLIGSYSLGLLNAVTLDGDNWNGHSAGGPTLGAGDPNDPMGIQAKNGASITLGTDVKIYRFARNGVFAYQGATIKSDSCIVTECGSDAFVASMGSNVRAISAQAIDCWGVGFYADYAGVIWATSATATGTKLRGGTSGGDGFASNYGGTIYADGSTSVKNTDTGYTSVGGTLVINSATAGGSAPNANSGYGLRAQAGAQVVGDSFISTYNGGGGLLVTGGAQYAGDSTTANNNTGNGASVTDGSVFVSQYFVATSNTSRGCLVERGSHASITNCDIQNNGSNGVDCQNATVRATSAVAIKNNGGYGVISRAAGIVDMQGVSEASVITGNTSGSCSPAKDTGTGISQSFIYASA